MESTEGQELKYSYTYTFAAKKATGAIIDGLSKAEIQSYINDLLGLETEKKKVNLLTV